MSVYRALQVNFSFEINMIYILEVFIFFQFMFLLLDLQELLELFGSCSHNYSWDWLPSISHPHIYLKDSKITETKIIIINISKPHFWNKLPFYSKKTQRGSCSFKGKHVRKINKRMLHLELIRLLDDDLQAAVLSQDGLPHLSYPAGLLLLGTHLPLCPLCRMER